MNQAIQLLVEENKMLREKVRELLPWATANASSIVVSLAPCDAQTERSIEAAKLLRRATAGEFDV